MVPADSDRIPRVPPYSGGRYVTCALPVPDCHCLRCDFPDASGSVMFQRRGSYNPRVASTTRVWALSGSLATTSEIDTFFLFLQVLRCFSSLRWPIMDVCSLQLHGLPHSETCGSKPVCSSPQLIAAYHVLLRRPKPKASAVRSCLLRCISYSINFKTYQHYVVFLSNFIVNHSDNIVCMIAFEIAVP